MSRILEAFNEVAHLKEWLLATGHEEYVPKNGYFMQVGGSSRKVGVITKGSMAMCGVNEKGQRSIFTIAFANEFVSNYLAHTMGEPCAYDIQALEPTTVCVVDIAEVDAWFDSYSLESRYRFMNVMAYSLMKRVISLKCDTPMTRYQNLLARVPDVHQKASMTALSAYLGLSREAFQRMKRNMQ